MSSLQRGFNTLGILLLVAGLVAMWVVVEQRSNNTGATLMELAEEVEVLKKQIVDLENVLSTVPRTEAVRRVIAEPVESATDLTPSATLALEQLGNNPISSATPVLDELDNNPTSSATPALEELDNNPTSFATPALEELGNNRNNPTTPNFIETSTTRLTRSRRTTIPVSTSRKRDRKKERMLSTTSEHFEVFMTDCEDETIKLNLANNNDDGGDYIKMCGEQTNSQTNESKYRVITELQIHKSNYKRFTIKCCHLSLK
ncbi:hypothetical protein ACHWQZ_G005945 [Mnemiopsis leidyi]